MGEKLAYEIRESRTAKNVRISVYPDGRVVVTKPVRASVGAVERFANSRRTWIQESVEKMRRRRERVAKNPKIQLPRLRRGTAHYKETTLATKRLVTERLKHYAQIYGFTYAGVSVRNQKTRWGSCTKQGALSFNMRLAFLPPEMADYVIVHELCHTKEHNHSARFWALVAEQFPNYKALRKQLRSSYVF